MPELAVQQRPAQTAEQSFCGSCPAVLELGCLLCGICQKSNLLQFATVGLESELIELHAPATTSSGDLKAVSSQRHRRLPSFPAVAADVRHCRVGHFKSPDF